MTTGNCALFKKEDVENRQKFYYRSMFWYCKGYGTFVSRGTKRLNRNDQSNSSKCDCGVFVKIVAFRPTKKSAYEHLVVDDLFLNHNEICDVKNYYVHPDGNYFIYFLQLK